MNQLKTLGAYGTKGDHNETSSFLITEHHVIDAGNLVRSLKEGAAIVHTIWLTHSHLDHIVDIAYVLDSYYIEREEPLKIMGLKETITALKEHFLNDDIWPDFTKINLFESQKPCIVYEEIYFDKEYKIDDDTTITPFETDHTVASCGYIVKKHETAVLMTADTYSLNRVKEILTCRDDITSLVIECSFPTSMESLAIESKHLTPALICEQISEIDYKKYKLYINHIKPRFESIIIKELNEVFHKWDLCVLKDGDIIKF